MNTTLQAILADAGAREVEAIEQQLRQELSAGSPWLNEA